MNPAISAPRGKMGRLVTREALKRPEDFEIVGGIGPRDRDYIGCDMSVAAKTDFVGANTYDDVEKVVAMSDGVVDFSTTEGAMAVARACVKYKKPLMMGTTGFTEEQMAELEECASTIPILIAHNTSKAVNLVYEIARMLTESIGDESDIEIIEMHDNKKLDAPSGTSKEAGPGRRATGRRRACRGCGLWTQGQGTAQKGSYWIPFREGRGHLQHTYSYVRHGGRAYRDNSQGL